MPHIINGVSCRSKIESLQHIIVQAKKGKIGPSIEKGDYITCQYRYGSGNNCAVGSLFSKEQLDSMAMFNEVHVIHLANRVGRKNIRAVTGMTLVELISLQKTHDDTLQSNYSLSNVERVQRAVEAVVEQAKKMLEKAQAKQVSHN